ncbi:histone deacetylase 6 [Clupea harengus]|uniref:Protein deacetylase HDAC6 n=1 Tax=Clupea harengus TaxID=7950 RepID=A0A6P8FEA6_CLUHA|nr:histone deacetylase 6 [Clupea harengus]
MDSGLDPFGPMASKGSGRSPQPTDNTTKRESNKGKGKKSALQEARRKGRMDRSKGEEEISNQLKNLDLHSRTRAAGTGLVSSDIFTQYHCLWDTSHPECPERISAVMDMAEKQGLLARCVSVEPRVATEEELLLVHTKEYIELMTRTATMAEEELKSLSDTYDSIFIHPNSFKCASLAVGAVLQLVDKVMMSEIRNGFSIARPPGHHAQAGQMNGYCMFNNLAIAARYAQKQHGVKRVLIVDWDVHHGQGIQYIFQEDPSVLYFSVHRYEDGAFWPHLKDSDSNVIGTGPGEGYNINLPWNQTGMKDGDYLTAFQQLLLPVAYEFQPELVLVAAGFDAVVGDPKGEMSASPQCFAVLTHLLKGLAQGRLVLALEGGYNLQSTAKGACACLKSLLGDSCPRLNAPVAPCESALTSISETITALYPHWSCLQTFEGGPLPQQSDEPNEDQPGSQLTGLVYDQRMMEHHNMWDVHHPEQPMRIARIFSRHEDLGLVARCYSIPARLATEKELALCHSVGHIQKIKGTEAMKPRDLHRLGGEYNSIFINNESYKCARLAAGACFNAAQAVLIGEVRNAVAIVRPPGHHAEVDKACGFCFFNTAALTARYAQSLSPSHKPLRVLILDWDVHHGNGTQHIFMEDDSVLYVSLHRYEDGTFFPNSEDADYDKVGEEKGRGFNVNIPWSGGKMGDSEYLTAFHHIVMPIATEFSPDLVLVSAGFDAARGDPLGGYQVTPEGYALLTHQLMTLAAGRVIIILEGGYNLTSISESMAMCTSMLLGDSPPLLPPQPPPHPNAAISINNVLRAHAPYWSSLRIQIPHSLRLSLPSPKTRGKRTPTGKGKKSPRQSTPAQSPGQRDSPETASPVASSQGTANESGLEDLTKGLFSLDLNTTTSANNSPSSVAVGGARRKVKPGPQEGSEMKKGASPGNVTSDNMEEEEENKDYPQENAQSTSEMQPVAETGSATIATVDQDSVELEGACGTSKSIFIICGGEEMDSGAVQPLAWCPHLEALKPVPPTGIGFQQPCEECGSEEENWVCLCCYKVLCGRFVNEHMVMHGVASSHPLVMSFSDISVWCYPCESYIDNKALYDAKNTAHAAKFGQDMPALTVEKPVEGSWP